MRLPRVRPRWSPEPAKMRARERDNPLPGPRELNRSVHLDGEISGDLTTTESVVIGATAVIRANIRATRIVIRGIVHGDLTATTSIELISPARVFGNLEGPEISIGPGVTFSGACRMSATLPTRAI